MPEELKPELLPVCTPRGLPVTSSHQYCFIHHQSIMCGHGKVRGDGDERNSATQRNEELGAAFGRNQM